MIYVSVIVSLVVYFVVKGKGNKAFSIIFLALAISGLYDGFIYLYNCYNGNYDPRLAYYSIIAFSLFVLLCWIKNSFKIILFDRRFK